MLIEKSPWMRTVRALLLVSLALTGSYSHALGEIWWTNANNKVSILNSYYGINKVKPDGSEYAKHRHASFEKVDQSKGRVLHTPDAIVVDELNRKLYWTNMNYNYPPGDTLSRAHEADGGSIGRSDYSGANPELIVPPFNRETTAREDRLILPKQIVIDDVNQKLYWADREGGKIWRSGMHGENLEILVDWYTDSSNVHQFVGVAVDPVNRRFYWTDRLTGKVYSASTASVSGADPILTDNDYKTYEKKWEASGSRWNFLGWSFPIDFRLKIVASGLNGPLDLALIPERYLFVAERGKGDELDPLPCGSKPVFFLPAVTCAGGITRLSIDRYGNVREKLRVINNHEVIGVAVNPYDAELYFTDFRSGIFKARFNGDNKRHVRGNALWETGHTGMDFIPFPLPY